MTLPDAKFLSFTEMAIYVEYQILMNINSVFGQVTKIRRFSSRLKKKV